MKLERQQVIDAFDEYIWTEMPARLIHIPDMTLVGREYLQSHYQDEFKDHIPELLRTCHSERALSDGIRKIDKYAIFSHRWLPSGEPTFQELSSGKKMEGPGWDKLFKFCQEANTRYNCLFAWADTCCIDKSSSSELDEAIRSMFRWYRNS